MSSWRAVAVGAVIAVLPMLASCWASDGPAVPAEDGSAAHAQPAARDELHPRRATAAALTDRPEPRMPAATVASSGSPPCATPGACAPRDVGALDLFGAIPLFTPTPGVAFSAPEAPTVEDVLEQGLRLAGSSPVHLAFRGTPSGSSARCEWRDVARTAAQREATIRAWLELDATAPLPGPEYAEQLFLVILDAIGPANPESARASFRALARGGATDDFQFLACYVDYTVSEYVLGAGPTKLTVAYDRIAESKSYDLYWRAHAAGEYGSDALMSEAEHEAAQEAVVFAAEEGLAGLLGTREAVLFVAPLGAHNAVAVEAWQVVDQWDLQTVDGTVNAVRYGALEGDPEHTQTLTNLKTRTTIAAASDAFASSRIANANGLNSYYRTLGAYGDIDPSDGATTTFTPEAPPPAMTCAGGTAVTDPDEHRALVHDCEALLDGKSTLAGTGTLNWSASTAIADWTGVTTSGDPERVTGLALSSKSLSGIIPADLGGLSALTTLNLSSNSLTGSIPSALGSLRNLTEVRLSGNTLTGCIPAVLGSVATNDLSSLSLLYCSPPAPGAPTAGTTAERSVALSWTAVSNTSKYRVAYRHDHDDRWTAHSASVTGASHTVDGLLCEQTYAFRVSAHGNGTTYTAAWGAPSTPLRHTTATCTPPVFGAESYSFTVAEDAAVDAAVGTVVATDPGGVTYAISDGNAEGAFVIADSTGVITVAGELDHETASSTVLTVAAWDAAGGLASIEVTVTVTDVNEPPVAGDDTATTVARTAVDIAVLANDSDEDDGATLSVRAVTQPVRGVTSINANGTITYTPNTDFPKGGDAFSYTAYDGTYSADANVRVTVTSACVNGIVVPNPTTNPGLVDDCDILLASKDTLRGTETLNWSADLAIASWEGITVGGSPSRVTRLWLDRNTSARLYGRRITLTGTIPAALGGLSKLEHLTLSRHELTGMIPPELASLSELTDLQLYGNQLTGGIPPELGNLSNLTRLSLSTNPLGGEIPVELGRLSNLRTLSLLNSQLAGSIPASLGDLPNLYDLGLYGNTMLTGCIPESLRGITLNDLRHLDLEYCTTTTTRELTTTAQGNGRVSPLPGTYSYLDGDSVTVTATPDDGHRVASWGGDCSGTAATCTLTMDEDRTASVTFERITYTLSVTVTGEGGSVAPDGTTTHVEDAEVTLRASWNDATHSFGGWAGHCSGTSSTCLLTMDAQKTVTATFTALSADRCATATAADCIRAVYRGAPGDYTQVSDIPAEVLLTPGADGRYVVQRGQQITVVTAAPLPAGWTRFYLERTPLEFGTPSPVKFSQLIKPVGTTYTFTVSEDAAAPARFAFELKAARPFVRPRPDNKPEIGAVVVTTSFSVGEPPTTP